MFYEVLNNLLLPLTLGILYVLAIFGYFSKKKEAEKWRLKAADNYRKYEDMEKELQSTKAILVSDKQSLENAEKAFNEVKEYINRIDLTFSIDDEERDKLILSLAKSYNISNKQKIAIIKLLHNYISNHSDVDMSILNDINTSKSTMSQSINILKSYYINKELSDTLNYDKTIINAMMFLILYKPKSK